MERFIITVKNGIIRVQTVLITLYELSCITLAPIVFCLLWGTEKISTGRFMLGITLYYLPMMFHVGIFGEKIKEAIDKIMMW